MLLVTIHCDSQQRFWINHFPSSVQNTQYPKTIIFINVITFHENQCTTTLFFVKLYILYFLLHQSIITNLNYLIIWVFSTEDEFWLIRNRFQESLHLAPTVQALHWNIQRVPTLLLKFKLPVRWLKIQYFHYNNVWPVQFIYICFFSLQL